MYENLATANHSAYGGHLQSLRWHLSGPPRVTFTLATPLQRTGRQPHRMSAQGRRM